MASRSQDLAPQSGALPPGAAPCCSDGHGDLAAASRRRFLGTSAAAVAVGGIGAALAGCAGPAKAAAATPAAASAVSARAAGKGDRIVLLGTAGGPPPEIDRTGIASALVVGDRVYLVDCGRSAVTQYGRAGLKYKNLKSVFITHLHADHIADYHNFLLLAGFGVNDSDDGIVEAVDVYGPGPAGALPPKFGGGEAPTVAPKDPTPGLKVLTDRQIEAFAYSTNIFMRDSGVPDVRDLVRVHEIDLPDVGADPLGKTAPDMKPFLVMDDGTVRVTAVLVPHGPVFPSFAYRFDTPKGSVVFSGDTSLSDNIVRLARGADVLVHEVIDLDAYRDFGIPAPLLDHLKVSHTDVKEIGPLAQRCGVGTLVLSHIVPADKKLVSAASWRKRAQKGFSGRVVVGDDLDEVPLRGSRS
ncbi:MBL fold metallo-hydrolase [Streptomyces kebangsaanensis]|uniref:MBL fold metallo-hydrolase n=1 Tax=Streptomyces kebangsaanensis TaxID=864058 RepID=UPI0009A12FC1|nr:MBL fold metallo-hydrolase [Streptomyces kebangsaanensis]